MKHEEPEAYWERAGEVSYATAMFAHSDVEKHVNNRLWQLGVDIGKQIGMTPESHILDLGCGDGTLANLILAKHFKSIDGYDLSAAAIKRAQALAPNENMRFEAADIINMDYAKLPQYDGAFLWGILHHVKAATPSILRKLSKKAKHVVVLEPNGNHILRKLLEQTASYKAAGEDSFRTKELEHIFKQCGYDVKVAKRVNLFPNHMPGVLFHLLKRLEPFVEKTPVLRALCTVNMWGLTAHE